MYSAGQRGSPTDLALTDCSCQKYRIELVENRPWPVHPRSPVSRLLVPMSTSILREANGKHTKHHITQAQRMHRCRPPSKRRKLPAQTDTAHTRPWHTHANSPRMREIWSPQRLMSHTITGYYHMKMGAALQLAASGCTHFSAIRSIATAVCIAGTLQPSQPMLRTQTHPTTCKGYQYNDRVIVHCHGKMQAQDNPDQACILACCKRADIHEPTD